MSGNADWKSASTIYDFTARNIKGEEVSLEKYRGRVCLIVNVASKCGLSATNYKELEDLKKAYWVTHGLRILAFPCNQFSGQEPGDSEEIACFAHKTMGATFDLFEKVDVNGDNAHPLWNFLKKKQPGTFGSAIKWNYTKFIVDRNGIPVERFSPTTDPSNMESTLRKYSLDEL